MSGRKDPAVGTAVDQNPARTAANRLHHDARVVERADGDGVQHMAAVTDDLWLSELAVPRFESGQLCFFAAHIRDRHNAVAQTEHDPVVLPPGAERWPAFHHLNRLAACNRDSLQRTASAAR